MTTVAVRARPVWRLYLELTKPKVVALIVFTAIVGTLLASPGWPPLDALVFGNLGIALVDVRVKNIELPEEVSESVFNRMRQDFARQAAQIGRGLDGCQ